MSIDLTGNTLVIIGGYKGNGQINKKVYSISISNAVVNLIFNDCDVGTHPSYYESPSDNALYVFPKNENRMVVLPYNSDDLPASITYQPNLQIEQVLLRGEENKLKVIGKLNLSLPYVIFDIDLFTGEVANFINTSLYLPIKAVFNNYEYALIYAQNENGTIDVYSYDNVNSLITLFEKNIKSVLKDGLFKIDGIYKRNDFIGLNIANTNSYLAPFYKLKIPHPSYTALEAKGFPVTLGNQVHNETSYNIASPLLLVDLYEYITIGKRPIRFNKKLHRLEILNDFLITLNCDSFLWATEFHNETMLIAVVYSSATLIYYLNDVSVIASKNVTSQALLHERKTNEAVFIENNDMKTQIDDNEIISRGNVYLIGGESSSAIFQDINEMVIKLDYSDIDHVQMDIISTSIIPSDTYGAYKAKGLKLSNKRLTVLYGLGYEEMSQHTFTARIEKSVLSSYEEKKSDAVHYITPDKEYINCFIITKKPALLNTTWGNTAPSGVVKEAFILSNHVYFTIDSNRYVAEINELKQLSDVIEFSELTSPAVTPLIVSHVEEKNVYSKELNKTVSSLLRYSGDDYFNNLFQYNLTVTPYQSKFDMFKTYNFEEITESGTLNILNVERVLPELYEIIGIMQPSFDAHNGCEFDIIIKRTFHQVKRKGYGYEPHPVMNIEKATIISRIPCTPYRLNLEKRLDVVKEGKIDQTFDMAFTFNNGSHELIRNDYSHIDDTWQVAICNGEESVRRLDIVLSRNGTISIYGITGDSELFPFKKDLLPIVLGYGEYEEDLLSYRYYLFVDIDGNIATFDKKSREFITVEGYDNIKVPYLSGEVTIFPSKTTHQGSIGKRVWAYSNENPYIYNSSEDKISSVDENLI
jgi:hypothetical protein